MAESALSNDTKFIKIGSLISELEASKVNPHFWRTVYPFLTVMHSYSRVWTNGGGGGGSGSTIKGEGVFEMQITPKVIAPKKFRENPRKPTKNGQKNLRNPPKTKKITQKPKKHPPKNKKNLKNPKIGDKFAFPPLAAKI